MNTKTDKPTPSDDTLADMRHEAALLQKGIANMDAEIARAKKEHVTPLEEARAAEAKKFRALIGKIETLVARSMGI